MRRRPDARDAFAPRPLSAPPPLAADACANYTEYGEAALVDLISAANAEGKFVTAYTQGHTADTFQERVCAYTGPINQTWWTECSEYAIVDDKYPWRLYVDSCDMPPYPPAPPPVTPQPALPPHLSENEIVPCDWGCPSTLYTCVACGYALSQSENASLFGITITAITMMQVRQPTRTPSLTPTPL